MLVETRKQGKRMSFKGGGSLSFCLLLALAFTFVACENDDDKNNNNIINNDDQKNNTHNKDDDKNNDDDDNIDSSETVEIGERLDAGQSLLSPNGEVKLLMQDDGNLVISGSANAPIWSTDTGGNPGAWALMQDDGNFVVYSAASQVLWATDTSAKGATSLELRDDGTLVLLNGNSQVVWQSSVAVIGVELNRTSLALTSGASETLVATISPSNATNRTLQWTSDNTSIASVDQNGRVTAGTQSGSTTITATIADGKLSASCVVTVTVPVSSVALNRTSLALNSGAAETLVATVNPASATNRTLQWTSSNSSIAGVDQNGRVTAGNQSGSTTITATTADGRLSASCVVTVTVPVSSVTLNRTSLALNSGTSETLVATINPSNATNRTLQWTSSNSSIAGVDPNGRVTAGNQSGSTTITATTTDGRLSASCVVTVTVLVSSVTLNRTSLALTSGTSTTLVATISPSNATNRTLQWTSSNTSIASVDQNGTVTAKNQAGSTTITARTADGRLSASCTVTVTLSSWTVTANFRKTDAWSRIQTINGWETTSSRPLQGNGAHITTVKNTSAYGIHLSIVESDARQTPTRYYLINTVWLDAGASTSNFSGRTDLVITWWVQGPSVSNPPGGVPKIEINWSL